MSPRSDCPVSRVRAIVGGGPESADMAALSARERCAGNVPVVWGPISPRARCARPEPSWGREVSQPSVGLAEGQVLAVLCMGDDHTQWAATVTSLLAANVEVLITTVQTEAARSIFDGMPVRVEAWDLTTASNYLTSGPWAAGFFATAPVVVPEAPFETAIQAMGDDVRVVSASFFSNDANYLSFPRRNQPSGLVASGHDERSLSRKLREVRYGQTVVPIPVPAGAGILFSTAALRALRGVDSQCPNPEVALLDVSLRGVKRGFRNVLDTTTFVTRPQMPGQGGDALNEPESRRWLQGRHHFFPTLYDFERDASASPLADAIALRRAAVLGLRVLVDGACFGPYENGTQVAVLAQIDALANNDNVREVIVGTQGGHIPDYARRVLSRPDVTICAEAGSTFPGIGDVDIIHRPYQPTGTLPFDHWSAIAKRSVITIQDLIAYDNGHYYGTDMAWLDYRQSMVEASSRADAIVAISHDTADAIRQARLPIDGEALFTIENGTDHLTRGIEAAKPPIELLENRAVAQSFVLVLGASYSHKNRDLAIRAWQELRRRGRPELLVLAGVVVPFGSTRNEEALVSAQGPEWPITLADVTSAERDWLLEHASVVLYPTSAEGFGLVPFEAAIMGTPTLFVEFGPLAELLPDVPVRAKEWSASAVADGLDELLSSRDVAQEQLAAVMKVGERLTWERFADKLVDSYFSTMARPAAR